MFKRFVYKLHILEGIRFSNSIFSKELVNLSLLIILVLALSGFFAIRSVASAQDTITSTTGSNTNPTVSNIILSTSFSCETLNTVKEITSTSAKITTPSFEYNNVSVRVAPKDGDQKEVNNYISNDLKNSGGQGLVTWSGSLKFSLKIPSPSDAESKIVVARNPNAYPCLDQEFVEYLKTTNYKAVTDIPSDQITSTLVAFHEKHLKDHPEDLKNYITKPPSLRSENEKIADNPYLQILLDTKPDSEIQKALDKAGKLNKDNSANNDIGVVYTQDSSAKLVINNSSIKLDGVFANSPVQTKDTIEFAGANSFIGTQQLANNFYQNPLRTDNVNNIANSKYKYSDQYSSSTPLFTPFVTDKATFPIIDLYSLGDAKITASACIKLGQSRNCDTGSQTSYSKTLSADKDELNFQPQFGLPYGNANLNDQLSNWTTFNAALNSHNSFSKANTFTIPATITPNLKTTYCPTGQICTNPSTSDISQDLTCYTCGLLLGKKIRANGATGALFNTDPLSSYKKIPIAKDFYTYAIDPMFVYGNVSDGSTALTRTLNYRGLSDAATFYNPYPYTNASINGQILPIQSQLQGLFNKTDNASFNYDYRIFKTGGLNVSSISSDNFYGSVTLLENNDKQSSLVVAFKASNLRDLTTLKTQAIDLSNITGFISKSDYDQKNFNRKNQHVNTSVAPQSGVSVDWGVEGCNTKYDIMHSIIPMTYTNGAGKDENVDYYIHNIPGVYVGGTDGTLNCNSIQNTNDVANGFANPNYWVHPTIVYPGTKFVTAYDPKSSEVSSLIMLVSKELNPDGTPTGRVRINSGKVGIGNTIWYRTDRLDASNAVSTFDLPGSESDTISAYLDPRPDLGIKNIEGDVNYSATIGPDGTKYVIVTSPNSSKIAYYRWSTPGLTPTVTVRSYDITSFTNNKPDQFNVSTIDIDPQTNNLAFGLNLTYFKKDDNSYRKDNAATKFPLVVEQTNNGFISYILDWKLSQDLYADNTMNTINDAQVLKNDLTQIKFDINSKLNGIMTMTGNGSEVFNVRRQASTQNIMTCPDNSPIQYTKFINVDNGKPVCNLDKTLQPYVTTNATYGNVLDITDFANVEKYQGKKALQEVQDFDLGKAQNPNNATGAVAGPDYVESTWTVSDDSLLSGPMFANDYQDESLKSNLANFVATYRNHNFPNTRDAAYEQQLKSARYLVDTTCDAAKQYQVSCALLIATAVQESSLTGTFGCNNGDASASCGAEVYSRLYKEYANGFNELPCSPFGKTYKDLPYPCPTAGKVKCYTAYSCVEQRYTPTDLRFYDPNNKRDFDNQCVAVKIDEESYNGIMLRPDHDQYCSGTEATNMSNPPHAAATDTRMNLRYALYGDLGPNGLIPLKISQMIAAGGMVQSKLDPRIKMVVRSYVVKDNPTNANLDAQSFLTTYSDLGKPTQQRECDKYRNLATRTLIFGSPDLEAIDYRKTIDACLGTDAPADQPLLDGKPKQVVIHNSELPVENKDYVNFAEDHTFTVPTTSDFYFDKMPAYHVYIRRNGLIEWGEDFTKGVVHAAGKCLNDLSCNKTTVGISLEGSTEKPPSDISVNKAMKLTQLIMQNYGINQAQSSDAKYVIGHCEITKDILVFKSDPTLPGFPPTSHSEGDLVTACKSGMDNFRKKLAAGDINIPASTVTNVFKAEIGRGTVGKKQLIFTLDAGDQRDKDDNGLSLKDVIPTATRSILKTLRDGYNGQSIKTTFFVTGAFAEKYPDLIKEIANDGHEIFNHTYSHCSLNTRAQCIGDKQATIEQELTKTSEIIKNLTKDTAHPQDTKPYFRLPYGDRSDEASKIANTLGYQSVYWTVDPRDWQYYPMSGSPAQTPESVIQTVKNNMLDGGIYLLHLNNNNSYKALPTIVKNVYDAGYKIVKLSDGVK